MDIVGFYLGNFDPFHNGHLNLALGSLEIVDKVFICPHKDNPLKRQTSYFHRRNMIREILDVEGFDLYDSDFNPYLNPDLINKRLEVFYDFENEYGESKKYILMGSDKLQQDMYAENESELLNIPHIIGLREKLEPKDERVLRNFKKVIILESYFNIRGRDIRLKEEGFEEMLPLKIREYIERNKIY